jgi:hypothetical protein
LTETQRALYLYGVCTQPEVIGFLRTQCLLKDDNELEQILTEWRKATKAFAASITSPDDLPDMAKAEDVTSSWASELRPLESDALFKKSFSMLPYSIKSVELDKVVAGQRYVNLDYVEELAKTIPPKPDPSFLVKFCLLRKSSAPSPAELQLGQNVYSYKSQTTDFRFLGGYPKPLTKDDLAASTGGGEPVAALVLLVGYGSPQVNLFQVGSRYVLNNGFHRLRSGSADIESGS